MIPPLDIATSFFDTFDKSAVHAFKRWMLRHKEVTKWLICSDYSLRDKTRPGDCFAFSLIPYDAWPAQIAADIKTHLPRDLKRARSLERATITWLRDPRRFHICILMNRNRVLYSNGPGSDQLKVSRESLRITCDPMIAYGRAEDDIHRVRQLVERSNGGGFNVRLLTDMTFLSIWYSVITLLLQRHRPMQIIGWFSDRDRMTTWCDGVLWTFASHSLHGTAEHYGIDVSKLQYPIAVPTKPTAKGSEEVMWFDHYIRPADWFAGTLAVWDQVANPASSSRNKFVLILRDVIANSDNIVVLKCLVSHEQMQWSRLVIEKA